MNEGASLIILLFGIIWDKVFQACDPDGIDIEMNKNLKSAWEQGFPRRSLRKNPTTGCIWSKMLPLSLIYERAQCE